MIIWWREHWEMVLAVILFMTLGIAFFCIPSKAGGPIEPTAPIRVPYIELRAAYPDMPLSEFFTMVHPWEIMAQQINNQNRLIYENIRYNYWQDTSVWIIGGTTDTQTIILPAPFKDSNYIALTQFRNQTTVPCYVEQRTASSFKWHGSFSQDSIRCDILLLGRRP